MTDKDFDQLEFNPLKLKDGELMQDKYDYFKRREVFCTPLSKMDIEEGDKASVKDDDKTLSDLLKFVVLFLDTDSPYWKETVFDERVIQCLKWAKIKKSDRAYYHISTESIWYQEIVTKYFEFVADSEMEEWISKTISLRSLNQFLRGGVNQDDAEKSTKAHIDLQKNIGLLRESLDKLQAKIFPKNKRLQKKIMQYAAEKDINVGYAEKMALTLKN